MIGRRILIVGIVTTLAAACVSSDDHKLSAQVADALPPITVPPGGGAFVLRTVRDGSTDYRYQVFVPRGFDASRKWPVIVFLHGSAEMGTDGVGQMRTGLASFVRAEQAVFPAVVVFPQAPSIEKGVGRAILKRTAIRALDQSVREFNGDTTRLYLAGYSLGAKVGYELVFNEPHRFAAFVAVAGNLCTACITGSDSSPRDSVYQAVIQKISPLPMWIFHSADDPNVPVADARQIVQLRRAMQAPVMYSEFPRGGHAIADDAFRTRGFFPWLFTQHR